MQLNELKDKSGARKRRMRVGRGGASGKGTTAGRGMKGQKSRSGVAIKGFEGGQMPIYMRLPKRGFNVPRPKRYNAVNLGRVQAAITAGRLKKDTEVNIQSLIDAGVIRRAHDGIRILAKGVLTDKMDFDVAGVSNAARVIIEKLGGRIKTPPARHIDVAMEEKPKKTKSVSDSDTSSDTDDASATEKSNEKNES